MPLTSVRVRIECVTDHGEHVVVELERGNLRGSNPLEVVDQAVERVRAGLLASEPGSQ